MVITLARRDSRHILCPPTAGAANGWQTLFNSIKLAIPTGSLAFWQHRLDRLGYQTTEIDNGLKLLDPDGVELKLILTSERLTDMRIVPDSDVPAEDQITRLLGTALHVPDPRATAAFFHEWLGLSVELNAVKLEDGQTIDLLKSQRPDDRTRFGRGSIDHFALAAPTLAKLNDYWERAQQLHLNTEEYADRGWFKSIYVRDPGDNRIEIATTSPGFSLDEPLLTLGHGLGLPPQFEPQRQEILAYYEKQGVDFHDVND